MDGRPPLALALLLIVALAGPAQALLAADAAPADPSLRDGEVVDERPLAAAPGDAAGSARGVAATAPASATAQDERDEVWDTARMEAYLRFLEDEAAAGSDAGREKAAAAPVVPAVSSGSDAGGRTGDGGLADAGEEAFEAPRVVVAPGGAAPLKGHQEFTYRCTKGQEFGPVAVPVGGNGEDLTVMGCPIRVYDRTYAFGNPQVAVHAEDPRQVAFFSLHGSPADDGRADHSRNGRAFTTFTSSDEGASWEDQPTTPAMPGGSGRGELPDGAMDSGGNLYVSYLWSQPLGDGTHDSVLGFFKAATAADGGSVVQAYEDPHYILGRQPGNAIMTQGIVQLPAHVPMREVPMNETPEEPTTEDQNGESTVPDLANATEERIVTVWHEAAVDHRNSTTGMSGWIDAAWTDLGGRNDWDRLNKTDLIGPCRDASNPVAWEGKVYVACVVERGYTERSRARVGDVDIWTIDVFTGKTELVDKTGLDAGRVFLSVTEDGYFAVASEKRVETDDGTLQRLSIRTAFGWHAKDFGVQFRDYGQELRQLGGGSNVPIRDAHLTGFVTASQNKVTLLSYQEWHDDPQDIQQEDPDPSEPIRPIDQRLTDYNKYVIAITECGPTGVGGKFELGTAVDQFNADNHAASDGRIFNDVQDGFFVVEDPRTGEELIYFAVNDYGAVQFGAIVASDALPQDCPVGLPPIAPPQAALPAAASLANPYAGILSAGLAVPMVAGIVYLLTVKRRVAQFVTAEDE